MKTLNTILILCGIMLFLVVCNSHKKENTNEASDAYNAATNTTTRSMEPRAMSTDSLNRNRDNNRTIDNTMRDDRNPDLSQEDYERQRNQQMYISLNMNADQINRYETSWNTAMQNWWKQNPQGNMSAQTRINLQQNAMRPILDDAQYRNFGQWTTANPYRY